MSPFKLFVGRTHNNNDTSYRIPFFAFSILVACQIIDAVLSNLTDVAGQELASSRGIILFFVNTSILFIISQYLLLGYVRKSSLAIRKIRREQGVIHKSVISIQFLLIAIFCLIVLQLVFDSYYSTVLLAYAIAISQTEAIIITGLVGFMLISWYRRGIKKHLIVLLYGVAALQTSIQLILLTISGVSLILWNSPTNITNEYRPTFPGTSSSSSSTQSLSSLSVATNIYSISFVLLVFAYLTAWVATAVLMRYYSDKLGKSRYWILVLLPVVFVIIGVVPTLVGVFSGLDFAYYSQSLLLFRALTIFSAITSAILFGIAFFETAKAIRGLVPYDEQGKKNSVPALANYLVTAGYGVVILTIAMVSTIEAAYPPFGLAASSFVGISSYFFTLGIFLSAIHVSQDVSIRRSIRQSTIRELKFLESIGIAQTEQEVQERVLKLSKQNIDLLNQNSTTIPTSPISDDDIILYVKQVIEEVKKQKENPAEDDNSNDDNNTSRHNNRI